MSFGEKVHEIVEDVEAKIKEVLAAAGITDDKVHADVSALLSTGKQQLVDLGDQVKADAVADVKAAEGDLVTADPNAPTVAPTA